MKIVAFAGPSVPPAVRTEFPAVDWRPPAQAGDLLEFERAGTIKVCLIDGYFDHRPAVRHKEILLLLAQGTPVFGAASIGALRAAEMDALGMIGVGAIYRAYASGRIVGDDEVALVHAPAEWDWRPMSVPLVDVRATLCRGVRARALSTETARLLMRSAIALHYIDRSWEELLLASALRPSTIDDLRGWLRRNQVDQKAADAKACLNAARAAIGPSAEPLPPMTRTRFLDALARERGVTLTGSS